MKFVQYEKFLLDLDRKLSAYFERDKDKIFCRKGCDYCCKNADYPLSYLEMQYLMNTFLNLEKTLHDKVRDNIKTLVNTGKKPYICPFLIDGECSVYSSRPVTCRVHGLAFLMKNGVVKLPDCANVGLNYSKNFDGKSVNFIPVNDDLMLDKIFKSCTQIEFGEIRSLIDWFRNKT